MKAWKLAGLTILAAWPSGAAYQYYLSDNLTVFDSGKWTQNGTISASSAGLYSSDINGGSWISSVGVPDPINNTEYEVNATLNLTVSGGIYVIYLRSAADASSYYSLEVQNPTFSGNGCSANLVGYKYFHGSITQFAMGTVGCSHNMSIRAVIRGPVFIALVNAAQVYWQVDNDITAGQPGIGGRQMPASNSISLVQFGLLDRTAPVPVNPQAIRQSAFPSCVDFQWTGTTDGPDGTGVAYYIWARSDNGYSAWENASINGVSSNTGTASDCNVSPNTSYTYTINAADYHMNWSSPTTVTVRTPPVGAIDPRRIGVHALGSYWGDMGEQIDTRSGNLNFTLPLLTAQGRGGWSVPFALSYNSQLWRQDSAGTWLFGQDVGYGFGWRLLAGAIVPYWADWRIDHYTYIDRTGAEYRLNINNGNVWTSREGVYVSYDATNQKLYFPDGSFWIMGCSSGGAEDDLGALYPTVMQDTNGNQILIRYNPGLNATWPNSSARISQIEDVRALQQFTGNPATDWVTYQFVYNNDPVPHLTQINPKIISPEGATFSYTNGQSLNDPFSNASFGSTTVLASYVSYLNLSEAFTYNGSGELTQVNLPYGGTLRWDYAIANYMGTPGTRNQREVTHRYLRKSAGDSENSFQMGWDAAWTSTLSVHPWYYVWDQGAHSVKVWWFNLDPSVIPIGLVTQHFQIGEGPWVNPPYQQNFMWWLDANGTPYISAINTTLEAGTANVVTMRTEQTVDAHGNVVLSKVYDYAAGYQAGSLLRTYTNTYLTDWNYTSRYIFNRLWYSTVSSGGLPVNLVTNAYDRYDSYNPLSDLTNPAPRQHDSTYNTSFYYRGNVTTQTTPVKTVTRWFDITGNVKTASDGNLNVSASTGAATNYTAPSNVTPNGNANLGSTYTFDGSLELTGVTMPNGATWSQGYYGYGMPSTTTSPYGATTTYAYNFNASASTVTATTNGHWVKSTMDGLGRTIKVEKGDGSGAKSVTESVYGPCACSPMGKVIQVSQPYAPGATKLWTTYTYDVRGRTLTMRKPDNSTTTYLYTGNTTKVTDAAGNWKIFTTDASGNLTKVTEPDPNLGNVNTNYTYNLLNKLIQVSMPRGGTTQTRTFTYDQSGQGARLMSATNPENGTVAYTYNADATVATRTDAKGQVVQYSYDSYQRLTNVHRSDGSQDDHYTYDSYAGSQNAWGRVAAVTFQGQPVKATNGADVFNGNSSFTYTYSYTQAGLVTAKRLLSQFTFNDWGTLAPQTLEADYTYDNEGRMVTVAYPLSGPTFTYGYDTMGRPNTLSQTAGTSGLGSGPQVVIPGATYGPAGELLAFNGIVGESRTYSNLLQLTSVIVYNGLGQAQMSMQYTYPDGSNIGKISKQKNVLSGEEVQYAYDALGRLVTAQTTVASQGPTWGYSYVYDGFGNLNAKNVTQGSPSAGWAITTDPATNRVWGSDANGNALLGSYDVENRLISTAYGAGLENVYGYDPSNKRIQKTLGLDGTNEIHFYGARGERLGVYKLTFVLDFRSASYSYTQYTANLYFGSRHLLRFDATSYTGIGTDRLGSENTNMYPWGEEKTTTPQNVEKFATYYRDGTGMDYADQRYYSSIMGRFLTPDPYKANNGDSGDPAEPQSWNRYTYVLNDPINFHDPLGLRQEPPDYESDPINSGTVFETTVTARPIDGTLEPFVLLALLQRGQPRSGPQPSLSNTETAEQFLPAALSRAIQALTLNSDCMNLFGNERTRAGRFNPVNVLISLGMSALQGSTGEFGSLNFQYMGSNAATTSPATGIRPSLRHGVTSSTVTISIRAAGYWNIGNAEYNADTLLHELGHAFNFLRGSGGSRISNILEPLRGSHNDDIIKQNCFPGS